jgi:hypothetical protein
MKQAALKSCIKNGIEIKGLENLKHAKMQSLRTGRIEAAVKELASDKNTDKLELIVIPRVPETMHTVIVKSMDKNGKDKRAILEVINILHPTEEVELEECSEIDDRRPPLGKH